MAARRFIFSDAKSSKFWQVEQNGAEFTVTYGKIGSDGQTKSKTLDSKEDATKAVEKLIEEKTGKGYSEVN